MGLLKRNIPPYDTFLFRSAPRPITGGVGGGIAVAGAIAVAWPTSHLANPFAVALLLFFITLPIVNAIMDWVSWWVSRWLGANLLDTVGRAAGRWSKTVSLFSIAGYMVIDLVVAVFLLWLLAMALPFVIQLFNFWCRGAGLMEPLPLAAFLVEVVQQ